MTFEDWKLQQDRSGQYQHLSFRIEALTSFKNEWEQKDESTMLPVGYEHPMAHLKWGRVKSFIMEMLKEEITELEQQRDAL